MCILAWRVQDRDADLAVWEPAIAKDNVAKVCDNVCGLVMSRNEHNITRANR
jgi:hypothetical protein